MGGLGVAMAADEPQWRPVPHRVSTPSLPNQGSEPPTMATSVGLPVPPFGNMPAIKPLASGVASQEARTLSPSSADRPVFLPAPTGTSEDSLWRPVAPRRDSPVPPADSSKPSATVAPMQGVQAPAAGDAPPSSTRSPAGEFLPVPPPPPFIPPADAPPGSVGSMPSKTLPAPRQLPSSAVVPELPVAPAELLVPFHGPAEGTSFGSPVLQLSRDYPSLRELCGNWLTGKWHSGWSGQAADEIDWPFGYVQTEYLMWWMTPLRVPVLATTNPDPNRFGYLNEPGTVPVVGPGNLIGPFRQGMRVRAGIWDADRSCALDGSFFFLGRQTSLVVIDSDHFPIITRPVFSPNPRPGGGVIGETGEAVAVPGILRGTLTVDATSLLWGADANLRCCLKTTDFGQLTSLVGYRYLQLAESLEVRESIFVVGPGGTRLNVPDPPGTVVFVRDRFATENRFHGAQVGLTWERRWGAWTLWGRATIAFGITQQELEIYGIQTRIRPNQPPVSYPGGLLAAASNLGTFHLDRFSVVPELTFQLGYRLTPNWQIYLGYNFLYWTNVMRPGDQIDRVVDLTQVPNAPPATFSGQFRPRPLFRQSDLLATGLQFGVEWRW